MAVKWRDRRWLSDVLRWRAQGIGDAERVENAEERGPEKR